MVVDERGISHLQRLDATMEYSFLRVSSSIHHSLLFALGLAPFACAEPPRVPRGPEPRLDFAFAPAAREHPPRAQPDVPEPGASAPCEPRGERLAWLDCDGDWIEVAQPVSFHPRRSIPPEPARSVLDAVAALLNQRREILLVRIEAYGAEPPADSSIARRRELDESQRRADAVLDYLWRKKGISAERLEAVGYGFQPFVHGSETRWLVRFRVVQRTETFPDAPVVR
jgi:hypothetical protein